MIRGKICLVLFVALMALVANASAATCTDASIKGVYGLLITGYDSAGRYQAGVGQINANGTGSFTGIESVSDDGVIYTVSH